MLVIMNCMRQIVREGDAVQRMLFIVRGHLRCSQALRNGATSSCTLGPGNFSGDELLSWCLRRPFRERLPTASATLVTLESTEALGMDAVNVKYVTRHFRYTFANDAVRHSARYYSPGWRTWAAVAVQRWRGAGTRTTRRSRRSPSSARAALCRGAPRSGSRSSASTPPS